MHLVITVFLAALVVLAQPVVAQTRPAPSAEAAMQIWRQLQQSGLSASQIRSRLIAEGFPATLLDAYLGSAADPTAAPTPDVLGAIRALGIVDTIVVDSAARRARAEEALPRDPLLQRLADSIGVPIDSLDIVAGPLSPDLSRRLDEWRVLRDRALRVRRIERDSGFTVFGLNLFTGATSQFDPNLAGPVDASYRLGPGDGLVLILTGDVEASYELPVTREGFIIVPQVGQIQVANLTLGQLEDVLASRLSRVYAGVGRSPSAVTRFSISVARLRSNQVYVVGDVARPGSYRVSSAGTAMNALYAAGGPTPNGSLRSIEVRRGGETVATLDLYEYLLRGNSGQDPRLQLGDVVFVPTRGRHVRVWGEVTRPATYELKEGEGLDALFRAAGGLTPRADRRRVQIERILPPSERTSAGSDRLIIDVVAPELSSGFGPSVPLQAGDVVRVFEIPARVRNQVTVSGNVWTPGAVAFEPGMRLSEALRRAGGLKPDSYLGQVLITRLQPDSSRVQLRAAVADTTGRAIDDVLLRDEDEIQVFSQTEFRPNRYVVISGAVRRRGPYQYREGMTLRDIVLLAGGLEESALLTEAEIARMPPSRAGGMKAVTQRVPLDSSYLFDRGPDGRYHGPPGIPAPTGPAPEVVLEPYDHVLIFRQPDWSLPQTVTLTGEVRRPGRYTLRSKNERLSDVIDRAGGLTEEAYAGGIAFIRQRRVGRIGIDLPAVLRNRRHRDNLLLVDGDSIDVPVYSPVVNVRGAVNSPVAVAYVEGKDLEYYIDASGGETTKGDRSRAYVTQPNGKVEARRGRGIFPDAVPEPQPGAVVFVPEREPGAGINWSRVASISTQVLSAAVAAVALISQLK